MDQKVRRIIFWIEELRIWPSRGEQDLAQTHLGSNRDSANVVPNPANPLLLRAVNSAVTAPSLFSLTLDGKFCPSQFNKIERQTIHPFHGSQQHITRCHQGRRNYSAAVTSTHPKRYLPARSCFNVSHTLQLKSSYPPNNNRPLLENATDVIPQMILSCEYIPICWSARMSNNRQVASSEPVANANPLGKNCEHR